MKKSNAKQERVLMGHRVCANCEEKQRCMRRKECSKGHFHVVHVQVGMCIAYIHVNRGF